MSGEVYFGQSLTLDLNRMARPWMVSSRKGRFERTEYNRHKEVCLFAIRCLTLPQGNRHDNRHYEAHIRDQLKWEHSVSLDFSVRNVPGILSEIVLDPPMNGPLVSSNLYHSSLRSYSYSLLGFLI